MSQLTYDYIIAGAGAAGLSLAWKILHEPALQDKKILVIEPDDKTENDRTWCFWENKKGSFEHLVHHSWNALHFYSESLHLPLDIGDYSYKMIRGIDFYQSIVPFLKNHDRCTWIQDKVVHTAAQSVNTATATFSGKHIFSSIFQKEMFQVEAPYTFLWQHFKGWVIRTTEPSFKPNEAVFMDFRTPQLGQTRFFYVLPTSEYEALVEATIYSPDIWPSEDYDPLLKTYIHDKMGIKSYEILHEEYNAIPMTDFPIHRQASPHVIPIGTLAGGVKASSGFAFQRIHRRTDEIVQQLVNNQAITPSRPFGKWRFDLYDRIFLVAMAKQFAPAPRTFGAIFKRNKPAQVLQFLDEDTPFWLDYKIINTAPILRFTMAAFYLAGTELKSMLKRVVGR